MKTSIEQIWGVTFASEFEKMLAEHVLRVRGMDETEYYSKTRASEWSKIETLGSLVDAVHNCLQHVMLARLGGKPRTYYSKEAWVKCIDYQHYQKDELLGIFFSLSKHLVHVLKGVSPNDFYKACNSASKGTYHRSLKDIVRAYLEQVQLGLDEICRADEGQKVHLKMQLS